MYIHINHLSGKWVHDSNKRRNYSQYIKKQISLIKSYIQFQGYSCASRGGSSWGEWRVRNRVWAENFGKYVDNSFSIAAGERWRSGNAGMTGSFYINMDWFITILYQRTGKVIGNTCRQQICEQFCTLNILTNLLIFTLLYRDSLSFSDEAANTTRTGKTRRRMWRSGKRRAKFNSSDSTAKTMRTWRMSSTLLQVKGLTKHT